MYFQSRAEAGYKLALELGNYRYEDCVTMCLSDGAVLVGNLIAIQLHTALTMMLVEEIDIPGEGVKYGTVNQSGRFTYNGMFSVGEIEEFNSEFHGYLEDKKREKSSSINRLLASGGVVSEEMLRGHNVIVVADALQSGTSLDAVADFLKPVRIKRLVIVTPIATVSAVDRMHILADELHVLGTTDNFLGANHYYDDNSIPDRQSIIEMMNSAVLKWQ